MKHFRILILSVYALLIFCMACSLHAEDVKTSDEEKSFYKLKLLWSREFPTKVTKVRIAPDGKQSGVVTLKGKGKNRISKFYALDENGKDIWSREVNGLLYPWFSGRKDILLKVFDFSKSGVNNFFNYYDDNGIKLWQERTDVNDFLTGPDGKYIGFSGILNYYEQSCVDWWELRDKDFNLLWKYKPKYNIDATLLSDGKTLMVEGREVKLFGKGGQELKKVVIPEIEPDPIAYQGCVNPTDDSGPLYLKGTKDGKYSTFVQADRDDKLYTTNFILYSVDMEKGTFWSFQPKEEIYSARDIYLSQDGKYLLLYLAYELLLFDNRTGERLLEYSNNQKKIKNVSLVSIMNSEYLALNFASTYEDEQTKRKWDYFIDFTGKRLQLFNNLIFDIYNCKQVGEFIVEMKGNKVNKYQIISGEK